jgi:PAS domain S-box-containing protein
MVAQPTATDFGARHLRAKDYHRVFEALPGAHLLLLPDTPRFTILAANAAYLAATGIRQDEVLGHGMFEVFPDNPDDPSATGVADLLASLERVLATQAADPMGVQKYDIPRRDGSGGFELKYWSPVNAPVLGPDGTVTLIVHRVQDVTDYVLLAERSSRHAAQVQMTEARAAVAEAEILRRANETREVNRQIRQANEALRQTETRLEAALAAGRLGAWEVDLATAAFERSSLHDGIFGYATRPMRWGLRDFLRRVIPEDRQQVKAQIRRSVEHGEEWATEYRIRRADNDALRWIELHARPLRGADGRVARLVGVVADFTERKRSQERQQLLLDELNHRVKNALASAQSMAAHTLRGSASLDEARELLMSRLVALGKAQDLLMRNAGGGALLAEVVRQTALPFLGEQAAASRVSAVGPEVVLAPKALAVLHAALHELVVNAVQHGALSAPGGTVAVEWAVHRQGPVPALVIEWIERGGPPVVAPQRHGFGMRLLDRSLAGELRGQIDIDHRTGGLVVRMRVPLSPWVWVL